MDPSTAAPPGFYPDNADPSLARWWDGTAWTAQTRPADPALAGPRLLSRGSRRTFVVTGVLAVLFLLAEVGPVAFVVAGVAAFVALPLYAYLVLALDRLHPEPRSALLWTFTAGATAVLLFAIVVNSAVEAVLVLAIGTDAAASATATAVAPVVEECGKGFVLMLLYRRIRHEISGPLDGVVYASMVGLGFSTMEDLLYYGISLNDGSLPATLVVRGVLSPFAHPVFTAFTGIGFGLLAAGRARLGAGTPIAGLGVAIGLHALWNGSTELNPLIMLGSFFGVMLPVFVGLIVVCRREARREQRVLRAQLRPEVQAGLLSEADVLALSDVKARRRLLRAARAAHPSTGTAARALSKDVLALASARDRAASGAWSDRYGPPEQVLQDLASRVARTRHLLPPPPPHAPASGLVGAFGVASP